MIMALIEGIIYILNSFPSKNGISTTMNLGMLVEGRPTLDFSKKGRSWHLRTSIYGNHEYHERNGNLSYCAKDVEQWQWVLIYEFTYR